MNTKQKINEVTFPATIPPIQKAIDFHGEGGGRLQLDVALSNEGAFLPILALRGKRLVVTIKVAE